MCILWRTLKCSINLQCTLMCVLTMGIGKCMNACECVPTFNTQYSLHVCTRLIYHHWKELVHYRAETS